MSGIGDRLNALAAVRDECRKRRGELEAVGSSRRGLFPPERPGRRHDGRWTSSRRRGAAGTRSWRAFERPRPDWPSLREGICEGARRAHGRAGPGRGRCPEPPAVARRVRPGAGRAGARGQPAVGPPGGSAGREPAVPVRGRGARPGRARPVAAARRMGRPARAGPRRRRGPRAGRAAGPRGYPPGRPGPVGDRRGGPIDRAGRGRSSRWASRADTSAAEAALDRAEQLLQAQQYEQAIESAGEAQQAARRAHQEAVQQASWRQMQADAEQRRWQGSQRRLRAGRCARPRGPPSPRASSSGMSCRLPPRPAAPAPPADARADDQPRAAADRHRRSAPGRATRARGPGSLLQPRTVEKPAASARMSASLVARRTSTGPSFEGNHDPGEDLERHRGPVQQAGQRDPGLRPDRRDAVLEYDRSVEQIREGREGLAQYRAMVERVLRQVEGERKQVAMLEAQDQGLSHGRRPRHGRPVRPGPEAGQGRPGREREATGPARAGVPEQPAEDPARRQEARRGQAQDRQVRRRPEDEPGRGRDGASSPTSSISTSRPTSARPSR